MHANAPVTNEIFEAALQCETKAYLLHKGAQGARSGIADWQRCRTETFTQVEQQRFRASLREGEYYVGTPPDQVLQQQRYRVLINCVILVSDIEARVHALMLNHPTGDTADTVYSPIRFVPNQKLSAADKLLLAFDALAISRLTGIRPRVGKIIHGPDHASTTISLPKLIEAAGPLITKTIAQHANAAPPPLILNKHCTACEFRDRCRQIAGEKDDLSLLANIREKDRKKFNDKGIFTVTQLSYTFRPRRRPVRHRTRAPRYEPALKALAIRKNRIHVVGTPSFSIPQNPVYLDVEGDPDRDFYYLIGLRYKYREADIHRSFWANTPADEQEMWAACLRALSLIESPQLIHYGGYETQFLKRMKTRYGDTKDSGPLDRLIASAFNLLSLTYAQIYFPTYSNSLKDIARHLGFHWSEPYASGVRALVWRSQWEASREPNLKQKLVKYNAEDCEAAQRIAETVAHICSEQPATAPKAASVNVNTLDREHPQRFGALRYAVPDFKPINEAAYWDYQRSKIYVRSNKHLCRALKQSSRRHTQRWHAPVNKLVHVQRPRPDHCPKCKSRMTYKNGRFRMLYRNGFYSQIVYDLRFSLAGIKRWVTKYVFIRYQCWSCKSGFNEIGRQETFGTNLKAYVIYQVIELLMSQRSVARSLGALFGLQMSVSSIQAIKHSSAKVHEATFQQILERIISGPLVHVDETQITVRHDVHYVWVFTNLEEVAYVHSSSRDASKAREILHGFKGVLVSDFYTAYDSIECAQQKCLIHLLRDINENVLKQPFNGELEELAQDFAGLLKPMVETIDRFGLKAYHLRKHKKEVARFYHALSKRTYQTEVAVGYRKRFDKNRDRLFTFLDHDGVPWNNNNAEHAIKAFARLRDVIGSQSTPKGIREYLVLLSISETCKYKGVSFLDFLRCGGQDIDVFAGSP
jgi:predicted RecB family nuclease